MAVPCDSIAISRTALFRNPVIHPAVTFRSEFLKASPFVTENPANWGQMAGNWKCRRWPKTIYFSASWLLRCGQKSAKSTYQLQISPGWCWPSKTGRSNRRFCQNFQIPRISLGANGGLSPFDPAPFCTHGESIVDIEKQTSHHDAYQKMEETLSKAGGAWQDANLQIVWRKVFVDRSAFGIERALWMIPKSNPDRHEIRTVRNVVTRILRRKSLTNVAPLHTGYQHIHLRNLTDAKY